MIQVILYSFQLLFFNYPVVEVVVPLALVVSELIAGPVPTVFVNDPSGGTLPS
jgi:hypothetical protein